MNHPGIDEDHSTERARRGRIALVVSIALNLVGLALFWRLLAPPPEAVERRTQTETVTIERKRHVLPIVVQPKVAVRPPKPRVEVHPQPVAAAPAPVAVAPHVEPHPQPPRTAPRPPELAKNPAAHAEPRVQQAAPGAPSAKRPHLSAQRLAQIEQDLQGTIDAERGAHAPLAVAPEPAPTMKHYAMDIGDLTTGALNHHGLCDPIKDWTSDGFDYYYVACNVKFSDGTVQRQDVPWPVRFPPNDDPFNGSSHVDKPLAMPLPGWTLPPGQTISVELREYAHEHGVEI